MKPAEKEALRRYEDQIADLRQKLGGINCELERRWDVGLFDDYEDIDKEIIKLNEAIDHLHSAVKLMDEIL